MVDSGIHHITINRPSRLSSSRFVQSIFYICLVQLLLLASAGAAQIQPAHPVKPVDPADPLPDSPQPQPKHVVMTQRPCRLIPRSQVAGAALVSATAAMSLHLAGIVPVVESTRSEASLSSGAANELPPCPAPSVNPFARFFNGPSGPHLTPKQKAHLAARNLLDPFNAVTILATAGISVAADSHSPYGPGMTGFAKNVGVAYTQDLTGQFFDVFLIPSLAHQDPRYHRMPHAPVPRRVLNAVTRVYWSQSDSGNGMPNYATFVGFAVNAEIMNLYVPGIQTNASATATRYATGLALAPLDNVITEFLPDFARRIHVRIVLVQRIINQVARTEPAGAP